MAMGSGCTCRWVMSMRISARAVRGGKSGEEKDREAAGRRFIRGMA